MFYADHLFYLFLYLFLSFFSCCVNGDWICLRGQRAAFFIFLLFHLKMDGRDAADFFDVDAPAVARAARLSHVHQNLILARGWLRDLLKSR